MASNQNTRIPNVPIRTPMFDSMGNITRTWVIFFERLGTLISTVTNVVEGGDDTDLYHRTLLLKDTTPGDSIADHVTCYADGTIKRITGVLRKPITSDLTVRVRHKKRADPPDNLVELVRITIPAATTINTPVEVPAADFALLAMRDKDVFCFDTIESDGQQDDAGVASFTLEWAKAA